MEVDCKKCYKNISSKDGLCSECRLNSDESQGFFGKFSHLYNTILGLALKPNENINNSRFDENLKENKRHDGFFRRIKSFYRNVGEDEPEESDHSESTNIVETNDQNEESADRDWYIPSINRNMSIVKRVTWADQGEESSSNPVDAGPAQGSYYPLESGTKWDRSLSREANDAEQEIISSMSSLGLRRMGKELKKINKEFSKSMHLAARLKEKLTKKDHKPCEYDYLPKEGEGDNNLWRLKPKDEEEYQKLLFFREAPLRKYGAEELSRSMERAMNSRGRIVERFGIEINRINIKCLFDTNWLNDEVINFYMFMLQEQSERARAKQRLPSCYFFNTYFFPTLCGYGVQGLHYDYRSVARWTKRKKVNVFERDLLIVPVHVNEVHWALGVLDMRRGSRRIMIFDSLGGKNPRWFRTIRRWLIDEHKDKLKRPLEEIGDWRIPMNYTAEPYAPRQNNNYDCGVFLCQFAKGITFATGFGFAKESSQYLRNSMVHEILRAQVEV